MKILLTGCTNLQCGRRGKVTYGAMFPALYEVLTRMGHQVDWRTVTAGEDLSMYDQAVIGLIALNKMSAKNFKYGAIWSACVLPHHMVIDDWKLRDVSHSIASDDGLWKCSYVDEKAMEYFYAAKHVIQQIESARYQWKCGIGRPIIPAYSWGDRSIFEQKLAIREAHYWDPTPWIIRFTQHKAPKQRRWVMAALSNHAADWIDRDNDLSWPVIRQFPERDVKKWQVLTEQQVSELYTESWGVLAHPHSTCGSGWWRPRFTRAFDAGCIVHARHEEWAGIFHPYRAEEIEALDDADLLRYADGQARTFEQYVPTRADSLAQFAEILRRPQDALAPGS